jgi:hypothetical protein
VGLVYIVRVDRMRCKKGKLLLCKYIKERESVFSTKELILNTTGNVGSFVGANKFIGTDEYNLNYIHRYHKPMNIVYIH